ncbi:MAG: exopolyphosphatase [Armatimonadota bacterium]|nr:MAG: exopolyphosphatase [Armatimonadota bacterium]
MPVIAAIDIGTNSVLLLVAELLPDGTLKPLLDVSEITRLGQGVDRTRRLDPQAADRTLQVLECYAAKAREAGAERLTAIGTSVLRDASDSELFLDGAREILRAPVRILSGDEEAELSWLSVVTDPSLSLHHPVAVADVGGGSTELITGTAEGAIRSAVSVDVGAVRMTERFLHSDPPGHDELQAARRQTLDLLHGVAAGSECRSLAGVGGTAVNLARMSRPDAALPDIHGQSLSKETLADLTRRLAAIPLEERRRTPGLEPKRADVIVAGALIFDALLEVLQLESLTVSTRGARFGAAIKLARGEWDDA